MGRALPDDLRVVGDIGPVARPADVRELPGVEETSLFSPDGDHLLRIEAALLAHPQILALVLASGAR